MAVSTLTITSGVSTILPTVEPVVLTLGTTGPQGVPGAGVPGGGTPGQILAKATATNYATTWIDNYTTDVRIAAKNDSGTTLAKGTVVYVSGANGSNVLVKPALATSDATSATTIGLTLQQMIPNNTNFIITQGIISGINTSSATAGDPVWLSGTVPGGLIFGVANKPVAPVHEVFIGTVVRAHATLGEILINITNGWELDELHNVKITSPTNGQVLTYDAAQSLWVNSSETGDITAVNVSAPITGGGTSGAVTIGHATSGVNAGYYGGAATVPTFTVDSTGHLTSAVDAPIAISPSQVMGTAVITTDPRLSDARTPTAHAASHAAAGTDPVTIAESQVTGLVSDLAAKAPTSRTVATTAPLTGGGDLTADRTLGVDNSYIPYQSSSVLRRLPLYTQSDAAERLLKQAVFWIDAAHSTASGQTITNLGWGGSALNATAGSTGSADSNDPKFLDWTGTNYVYFPGATGNYLSVPDAANLDITGDIDVRIQIAMDDWTPGANQSPIGKWNGPAGQRTWRIDVTGAGYIQFIWSWDGTNSAIITSTDTVASLADGAIKWIRCTLDVDNGAVGNDVKFYTSDNGSTWTQLGNTVTTAGVTSIYASTANVDMGAINAGALQQMAGKVYRAQVLNGIGGTVVLDVDTSQITSGSRTAFTALSGQTVTVTRATSGRKT
ncbi:MAG: hypothetical protein ACR2IJ_07620, partial [Fluviibacter sp.]